MNEEASYIRPGLPRPRIALAVVLLIATILTTTAAGAAYRGVDVFANPYDMVKGITFSFSLLLVLGTHELAHFIASRRHGVYTTLPLFIPGPPIYPMIGTFGAVIRIKSPITTRSALVDIGVSGPLCGFVMAFFVLAYGLTLSTVVPYAPTGEALAFGAPLLYKMLANLIIGTVPEGHEVLLHPAAFAGWIGMFVTAMNLLPMGQLDGGHVVYALIGRRHRAFSIAVALSLVVIGYFTWPGWYLWAGLTSLLGLRHPPVMDEDVPLDGKRRVMAAVALAVFVLTFMPTPFYIV
ncbi:MAG: site-2 protease family protein [Deltaproteobacteria bacterium]|nr:site-2 protease family protein [Deltaproteobacteria bacterium]